MEKKQTLHESYEFKIPHDDIEGIAKASVSSIKKLLILLLAIAGLIVAIGILGEVYTVMWCGLSVIACIALFFLSAIRSSEKSIRQQKDFPKDRYYKLCFYDDFLVLEVADEGGISLLSTTPLSSVSIIGENDKYIIVTTGIYSVPIPKSILPPTSFIFVLYSMKGKKPEPRPDAPKYFIAPIEDLGFAVSTSPQKLDTDESVEEKTTVTDSPLSNNSKACSEFDGDSFSIPMINLENSVLNTDTCEENAQKIDTSKEHPKRDSDGFEEININDEKDASSFEAGSFDAYSSASAPEASSPYLYESVVESGKSRKLKTLGIITFALSIFSIFLSLIATVVTVLIGTSNTVPLLIISLLPISSLVLGVLLYKNKEKCLKNFLGGILAILIMFSMGGAEPIMTDDGTMERDGEEFSAAMETKLGIDIPELEDVFFYTDEENGSKELTSNITAEEAASFIEYAKAKPDKFVISFPSTYVGLLPDYDRDNDTRIALLYNETQNSFNSEALPISDGTYHMVYLFLYEYEDGSAFFKIIEYDTEYITSFPKPQQ